jgi:hypothetical protein
MVCGLHGHVIFRGIQFTKSNWCFNVRAFLLVKISGEINRDAGLIFADAVGRDKKLAELCSAGRVRASFDFAQGQAPPYAGRADAPTCVVAGT